MVTISPVTTPVAELVARVEELNSPDSPFVYRAENDRIIGSWNVAHVRYIAVLGAGQIDEDYSVEVTFDPETSTYVLDERQSSSELKGGVTSDGGFRLSGGSSAFRGKQSRRTRGFVAGTHVSSADGTGTSAGWSFDSGRIKQPLLEFLERNGWTKRRGFFGRLFRG